VVRVKVIEADEKGRLRLSMKALLEDQKASGDGAEALLVTAATAAATSHEAADGASSDGGGAGGD